MTDKSFCFICDSCGVITYRKPLTNLSGEEFCTPECKLHYINDFEKNIKDEPYESDCE